MWIMMTVQLLYYSTFLVSGKTAAPAIFLDQSPPPVPFEPFQPTDKNAASGSVEEKKRTIEEIQLILSNDILGTNMLEKRKINRKNEERDQFKETFDQNHDNGFINYVGQISTAVTENTTGSKKGSIMNQSDLLLKKNKTFQLDITTGQSLTQRKTKEIREITGYKKKAHLVHTEMPTIDAGGLADSSVLRPVYQRGNTTKLIHILRTNATNPIVNKTKKERNSSRSKEIPLPIIKTQLSFKNSCQEAFNNCLTKGVANVSEVPEWIFQMNNKMKEDEKLKTQYKYYSVLRNQFGEKSLKSNLNSSSMKIDKQGYDFRKLKLLMLYYFESLNFNQDDLGNDSMQIKETIMNTTNIVELIEKSSKMIEIILEAKKVETDLSGFVKTVVKKQIKKCNKIFNNHKFKKDTKNSDISAKLRNNKRLFSFTRCVNVRLETCINKFVLWLGKGQFYLRPWFQLTRAYESYERTHYLKCR